jgi:hypothetical protein
MIALIAGLVLLALDKEPAIGILVAGAILAVLGHSAQGEENHRELVELLERERQRRD